MLMPLLSRLGALCDPVVVIALALREILRPRRPGVRPPVAQGQLILAITAFHPDGKPVAADVRDSLTLGGYFLRALSVSLNFTADTVQRSEPDTGLRFLDLPMKPLNRLSRWGMRRSAAFRGLVQALDGLAADVRQGDYGVITAHDPHLLGLMGLLLARRTGIPLVLHLNSNFENKYRQTGRVSFGWARWRWLEQAVERFVMARAAIIVADRQYYRTSGFVPADLHQRYRAVGVFPPLVVDRDTGPTRGELLARWGLPDRPVILYVGRLHPHKLAEDLIPFAKRLFAMRQDWTFVLAGDGPLRQAMEAEAAALGDRVHFLGNQAQAMVADLFRLCHFVVATHGGVTLVEAATAAKPTLAYAYDWMPEFIADGETGGLVPVRDVAALADKAARWLDDPPLVARLGEAAYDLTCREYRRDRAIANERAVYEDLEPRNGGV
jgi:glycosyltransferase involved in cell wall biosynthesis